MASIKNIKQGQELWSVIRQKMGNTTIKRGCLYRVVVTEIGPNNEWIMASWNGNPPRKYYDREVKKLKTKKPMPKTTTFGMPSY